jgi:GAF domain-containing protein
MDSVVSDFGIIAGSLASGQDVIQEALMTVRDHLGMEIAYFSEFVDGRSIFRHVDAPGLEHLIKVGDSHDLADVYCNHILEGRLPEAIPDTSELELTRRMPITSAAPIGSHVSIPVRLSDGTPFGMFCCLSPRPMPSLNERDVRTMRMFAGLVAKQVNAQLEQRVAAGASRSRITGILARPCPGSRPSLTGRRTDGLARRRRSALAWSLKSQPSALPSQPSTNSRTISISR